MHEKVVSEDQESRVYRNEWRNLYDFLNFFKHEKAYEFACQYCEGKEVLDFGCGSGYGAEILAKVAKFIVAVDTSPVAVQYCLAHCDLPNVTFEKIEPDYTLRFDDKTFDVVVSFQVIEHIPDVPRYLGLLKRVLKPAGALLITTPNRTWRLLPFQKPWNRDHYREYSAKELDAELCRVFPSVQILGVYGSHEYNDLIRAYVKQTPFDVYVYQPARQFLRRVLPKSAVCYLQRISQATKLPSNFEISHEMLNKFSVDDIVIDGNLYEALDFFGIVGKHGGAVAGVVAKEK